MSDFVDSRPKTKHAQWQKRYLGVLSVVVLLAAWEVASHVAMTRVQYADTIIPSLERIATNSLPNLAIFFGMGGLGVGHFGQEASYGVALKVIGYHTGITFLRIIVGFIIGCVVGILGGLLVKASRALRSFTIVPTQLIRIVPLMALITLFLVWFGDSEIGYVLFIGFGVSVALFINTLNAIDNISPIYQKYARTLGANKFQLFTTVVLPAIIPELMGGLKMIVGQAWGLSMTAEFISSQNGLGRIIVLARERFDPGMIIIILTLYVLYTLVFLRVLYWGGNYITRWMPRMESR